MSENEGNGPGFATLSDLETSAQPKVIPPVWGYIQSGAGAERTVRANREAFDRRELASRAFRDVRKIDLSTHLLGTDVEAPFYISPMAYQGLVHPEGEKATARAAARAGVLLALGTLSSCSLEEVAQASGQGPRWFQLYVQDDPEKTRRLLQRAEKAGYRAMIVTVDVAVLGARDQQASSGLAMSGPIPLGNGPEFVAPPRGPEGKGAHFTIPDHGPVTEEVLERVRGMTSLPLVVKGILTPEDARTAVRHGAKAVIVSNHGGRQLDGAPAALDVLPSIVSAVGDRAEVYMDSGIRRGSDVLMALAMGAKGVGLGRPVLWSLAAGGEVGVGHLLTLLKRELANVMALTGSRSVSDLDPSMVGVR